MGKNMNRRNKELLAAMERISALGENVDSDIMPIETIHGLLSAVAISPSFVLPSDWLPLILGSMNGEEPDLNDESMDNVRELISAIFELYNCIVQDTCSGIFEPMCLAEGKPGEEPSNYKYWSSGFLLGALSFGGESCWEIPEDFNVTEMLLPIIFTAGLEQDSAVAAYYPSERFDAMRALGDDLGHAISVAVEDIKRYFEASTPDLTPPSSFYPEQNDLFRQDKEIGRNEPCPCGSGKKFKKCCGK